MWRRPLIGVVAAISTYLLAVGVGWIAWELTEPDTGALDTELAGVQQTGVVAEPDTTPAKAGSAREGKQDGSRGRDEARKPKQPAHEQPCWPIYGRTPARTSDGSGLEAGRPRGTPRWVRRIGTMEFPPSYCDGVVYVNNEKGTTFAIRARDGAFLWKRQTGTLFDTTPAIAGRRLIIGGIDGRIQALDRKTGRNIWTVTAEGAVESSPVVVDGIAYATSLDRRVYAIDVATGKVRWAYRTGGDVKDSPAVVNGTVYVGNYAGQVLALDARTGKLQWERSFRLDPLRSDRIYSSMAISRGRVHLGTIGGKILALDAADGSTLWQVDAGHYVYATPAVADGVAYVGDYNGVVRAIRSRDGDVLWQVDVGGRISGSAVVIGDLLYVSTLGDPLTVALDLGTGREVWRRDEGRYVPGIATDDSIYLSAGAYLSAFNAPAGRVG